MKYNKWIDNISRLFIPRPSVVENKRFDMAERISNFEDEFFIRFKSKLAWKFYIFKTFI